MLVLPGCRTVGTISGGCLENAVAREAWGATRTAEQVILEVESAPEDDTWGPASGCHGRLYLLAERILAGQHSIQALQAAFATDVRTHHRPTVLRCIRSPFSLTEKIRPPIAETITGGERMGA